MGSCVASVRVGVFLQEPGPACGCGLEHVCVGGGRRDEGCGCGDGE